MSIKETLVVETNKHKKELLDIGEMSMFSTSTSDDKYNIVGDQRTWIIAAAILCILFPSLRKQVLKAAPIIIHLLK